MPLLENDSDNFSDLLEDTSLEKYINDKDYKKDSSEVLSNTLDASEKSENSTTEDLNDLENSNGNDIDDLEYVEALEDENNYVRTKYIVRNNIKNHKTKKNKKLEKFLTKKLKNSSSPMDAITDAIKKSCDIFYSSCIDNNNLKGCKACTIDPCKSISHCKKNSEGVNDKLEKLFCKEESTQCLNEDNYNKCKDLLGSSKGICKDHVNMTIIQTKKEELACNIWFKSCNNENNKSKCDKFVSHSYCQGTFNGVSKKTICERKLTELNCNALWINCSKKHVQSCLELKDQWSSCRRYTSFDISIVEKLITTAKEGNFKCTDDLTKISLLDYIAPWASTFLSKISADSRFKGQSLITSALVGGKACYGKSMLGSDLKNSNYPAYTQASNSHCTKLKFADNIHYKTFAFSFRMFCPIQKKEVTHAGCLMVNEDTNTKLIAFTKSIPQCLFNIPDSPAIAGINVVLLGASNDNKLERDVDIFFFQTRK